MTRFHALAAALLVALPPLPALAATLLGTRTVAYGSDTDVIPVPGAARYHGVRLCVAERAVEMVDVDVHFANGGHQDIALRAVIPAGECTRWVDLDDPARNITALVLRYSTYGNAGPRAAVTAWGR